MKLYIFRTIGLLCLAICCLTAGRVASADRAVEPGTEQSAEKRAIEKAGAEPRDNAKAAPAPPKTRVPPAQPRVEDAVRSSDVRTDGRADEQIEMGTARVKDIADLQRVRGNYLVGYGLVMGLDGTGDGQTAAFTASSIVNMLTKLGVSVTVGQVQVKNVAAVMITADLPAFAREGSKIDITVSSLGDAKSLQGGQLLRSELYGPDGKMYVSAQGAVSIGGFNVEAGGNKVQKNHVTVGRVPGGGIVEAEVPTTLIEDNEVSFILRQPDFTTARRMVDAINHQFVQIRAHAIDSATISVPVPPGKADDLITLLADLEQVRLTPDVKARIVVNERTGIVAVGGNVRLSPGAVAHGAISIRVTDAPIVQPGAPGALVAAPTVVVPKKELQVVEKNAQFATIDATTSISQLVKALNGLGVTAHDLIAILQAMHAAGMISAEIEVQ